MAKKIQTTNDYIIRERNGKWEPRFTFGNDGEYPNELTAQAECDRRNGQTAEAAQSLTDEQIDKLNRTSIEHGSGLVLPTLRNADKIARRAELYNEEPPED